MIDEPVEDLITRLERERRDADRAYNDALTAVDRAIPRAPAGPPAPPPYDATQIDAINRAWRILPDGAPSIDRSWRGRMRGFVWRLVGPPLDRQQQFNAAVVDHLNRNARAHDEARRTLGAVCETLRRQFDELARLHDALIRYLQLITPYVDTKDRSLGGPDLHDAIALAHGRTLALSREVERLQQGALPGASRPPAPEAVTYVGFEDRFRGPRDAIRGRLADYAPLLAGASDVLDIGCGRGELLDVLRAQGIRARGIDANAEMVEVCRSRGLDAETADALTYLNAQPDGSLGGLTAIQVVEHFDPPYLARLLDTAFHKLRPGAPIVLETINPACWMAFFETYLRDLTHARPLHPDTLRFLVQASGFSSVDVQYRSPVRDADRLARVADADADTARGAVAAVVNQHADALNARLFSFMDYVVLARR